MRKTTRYRKQQVITRKRTELAFIVVGEGGGRVDLLVELLSSCIGFPSWSLTVAHVVGNGAWSKWAQEQATIVYVETVADARVPPLEYALDALRIGGVRISRPVGGGLWKSYKTRVGVALKGVQRICA